MVFGQGLAVVTGIPGQYELGAQGKHCCWAESKNPARHLHCVDEMEPVLEVTLLEVQTAQTVDPVALAYAPREQLAHPTAPKALE